MNIVMKIFTVTHFEPFHIVFLEPHQDISMDMLDEIRLELIELCDRFHGKSIIIDLVSKANAILKNIPQESINAFLRELDFIAETYQCDFYFIKDTGNEKIGRRKIDYCYYVLRNGLRDNRFAHVHLSESFRIINERMTPAPS